MWKTKLRLSSRRGCHLVEKKTDFVMCRSCKLKKDAKLSSTANSQKNSFSILDQKKRTPPIENSGRHLQVKKVKDISSKNAFSPSVADDVLKSESNVNHLNAQDINIALATFPEFFKQGLVIDQDTLAQQPDGQKLISNGLSVRKQNLKSECGGLVLWYIREYGL